MGAEVVMAEQGEEAVAVGSAGLDPGLEAREELVPAVEVAPEAVRTVTAEGAARDWAPWWPAGAALSRPGRGPMGE